MGTVTIFTAERMQELEDQTIVDARIDADHLILIQHNLDELDVGNVKGDTGATGATGASGGVATGTFTPTLTGITLGTGGSPQNTGRYTFVGGPNVGDSGILFVTGFIKLGTSGMAVGNNATTRLPTGFNLSGSNIFPVGLCVLSDISLPNSFEGTMWTVTVDPDDIRFIFYNIAGTYPTSPAGTTSTTPFTWAANDEISYSYNVHGIRV